MSDIVWQCRDSGEKEEDHHHRLTIRTKDDGPDSSIATFLGISDAGSQGFLPGSPQFVFERYAPQVRSSAPSPQQSIPTFKLAAANFRTLAAFPPPKRVGRLARKLQIPGRSD